MSRFPTEAKHIRVHGLSGSRQIRFIGTIPHGKHTREVAIDVDPELIVQIAAALIATKDHACDSEYQRRHRHHSELGWVCGHAMWHVDNPDAVMPCIERGSIDVSNELVPIDVKEIP